MKSTRLSVRLTPRGGRDAIDGWSEPEAGKPVLRVRVSAPPVDGLANEALVALLSKSLGLPRRSIRFHSGETARVKILEVEGVSLAELNALLPKRC